MTPIAITSDLRLALCSDGTEARIVLLFDIDGDQTTEAEDACAALAITDDGRFAAFWCADMERVTVN